MIITLFCLLYVHKAKVLIKCLMFFFPFSFCSALDDHDDDDDDELEKTLAILIGIIAAVALLVVFLSYFRKKLYGDEKGTNQISVLS